ncbi:hypothetical protein N0V87_008793 [Didymella glomerata]|uniref:Uncharacterized protein n=1 Tax=Didymella glomerata TaxID=749621 RepID=A0A9W8WSC3_9PLEO|nr:hypothetical protein N0V87_008793 [Didymella glomerata]
MRSHQYGGNTRQDALADAGPEQQLDLHIEPAAVRLKPGPDELYTWRYPEQMAHLFQKQLSKQPQGVCEKLANGVGKTFEAVRTDACRVGGGPDDSAGADESFTTRIERLEHEYALLEQDYICAVEKIEHWQARAMESELLRASAEEQLATERASFATAKAEIQNLHQRLDGALQTSQRLQQQRAVYAREVDEVARRLSSVKSSLCTDIAEASL